MVFFSVVVMCEGIRRPILEIFLQEMRAIIDTTP